MKHGGDPCEAQVSQASVYVYKCGETFLPSTGNNTCRCVVTISEECVSTSLDLALGSELVLLCAVVWSLWNSDHDWHDSWFNSGRGRIFSAV